MMATFHDDSHVVRDQEGSCLFCCMLVTCIEVFVVFNHFDRGLHGGRHCPSRPPHPCTAAVFPARLRHINPTTSTDDKCHYFL